MKTEILDYVGRRFLENQDIKGFLIIEEILTCFPDPQNAEFFLTGLYALGTETEEQEVSLSTLMGFTILFGSTLKQNASREDFTDFLMSACRVLVYLSVIKKGDLDKGSLVFRRDSNLETELVVDFREAKILSWFKKSYPWEELEEPSHAVRRTFIEYIFSFTNPACPPLR